jgi:hypothetical protein
MQEVKTVDLAGPALDWAIAQIESVEVAIAAPQYGTGWRVYKPNFGGKYSPSTDWAFGGPLIQKYRIGLIYAFEEYEALIGMTDSQSDAAPLLAVSRCIVAHVLGDSVQVPAELLTPPTE